MPDDLSIFCPPLNCVAQSPNSLEVIPANDHMLTDLCVKFAWFCSSTSSFSIAMLADTVHSWRPAAAGSIWVAMILSALYGDSLMELRDGCLRWLSSMPRGTPVTWA